MRIVKKYANRRLYDTEGSCYITLDDVRSMVLNFQNLKVIEASSGRDITDQILLQIIANVENNKSHQQIFTQKLLEQLIRLYSYENCGSFSQFLETSLTHFLDPANQGTNPMDFWMDFGQKQLDTWQQMFGISSQNNANKQQDTEDKKE